MYIVKFKIRTSSLYKRKINVEKDDLYIKTQLVNSQSLYFLSLYSNIWWKKCIFVFKRRVWRYQRVNQNPYIEEEQTTQWPKEKVQKDKQRSTKHTYKSKDRVTWTPLKTGDEHRCSEIVSSPSTTSGTRRVNIATHAVVRHEWGTDREVLMTSVTNPWSFVTQIFHNGQPR